MGNGLRWVSGSLGTRLIGTLSTKHFTFANC